MNVIVLVWMLYGAGTGNGQSHHEYFTDIKDCYSRLDALSSQNRGFTWVSGECKKDP